MQTLTFEQLRINLTLTFNNLDEPVQVIKRGRVQGYIIKELPCESVKDEPGKAKKPECHSKPEPEKSIVASPGGVDKPATKPDSPIIPIIKTVKDASKARAQVVSKPRAARVQHHPQCKCAVCKAHKSAHLTA